MEPQNKMAKAELDKLEKVSGYNDYCLQSSLVKIVKFTGVCCLWKLLKEVGHTFVVMVCILPIFNSNMASFWDCYF